MHNKATGHASPSMTSRERTSNTALITSLLYIGAVGALLIGIWAITHKPWPFALLVTTVTAACIVLATKQCRKVALEYKFHLWDREEGVRAEQMRLARSTKGAPIPARPSAFGFVARIMLCESVACSLLVILFMYVINTDGTLWIAAIGMCLVPMIIFGGVIASVLLVHHQNRRIETRDKALNLQLTQLAGERTDHDRTLVIMQLPPII